jgi:hypothetical protein
MKKVLLVLTAITLVFAVLGCSDGGSSPAGASAEKTTYKGEDNSGNSYTLEVTAARAAKGDGYVFTIGSLKSTGKVESATSTSLGLEGFTVSVSGSKITNVVGTIVLDSGDKLNLVDGHWDVGFVDQFDEEEGITRGITVGGGDSNVSFTDGVIDFSSTAGSAIFVLLLPDYKVTSETGDRTIVIEYICKVTAGEPKLTLKDGSTDGSQKWSDPVNKGSSNIYPTLKAGEVATLEIPEKIYADGSAYLSFQRNGDTNGFKIKILGVTWEEGE